MSRCGTRVTVVFCAVLAACAAPDRQASVNNPSVCKKVYVAGSAIPRRQCETQAGLTDMERDRLRRAIGGPIVTEQDVPIGD